jgi:hypothetical protein
MKTRERAVRASRANGAGIMGPRERARRGDRAAFAGRAALAPKGGEAPRTSHEVHVFRDAESRRWTVASAGRRRSRHRRQATAIRAGIRVAKRRRVDLVTHGRDGRFRRKDSYGNETRRRDGTR